MNGHRSYRNLPALAGICSINDAMKIGLSVEQCVSRLKRYHYSFKRLHNIFTARLTAEPIYELKTAFSLHSYICAEHITVLCKRIQEMREPPLGLERVPDVSLGIFFDEILCAPTTETLVLGIYEKAIPALQAAMERHLADTNRLADQPTIRVCRFAILELLDIQAFGKQAVASLVNNRCRKSASKWLQLLDECLLAAGQLGGGADAVKNATETIPERVYSAQPYKYDPVPKRDERFSDPYNMGVNAEVFLYDERIPPEPKTLMMFYKRLREIDVPEMMASIIVETPDKPWDYYRDLTRHLWDEARHSMMGEVGFAHSGIDWTKNVAVNYTWSLALNTQLKPLERHAALYFIEQGLMPKTGKRFEWEVGLASHNPLSALFQDYDWADEVLHVRIGRDWYLNEFKNKNEAVRFGEECWSRVLMKWGMWKQKGLTRHRNWWPKVYQEACKRWGVQPDPKVLSYSTSYQRVRPDLKILVGSS